MVGINKLCDILIEWNWIKMRFLNKVFKYLIKLKWNEDFVVSWEKLIDYFERYNILEFEKIIEF